MATNRSLSEIIVNPVSAETKLSYSRPGVQITSLHAIRKGEMPYNAILNLKGLDTRSAKKALISFIANQAKIFEGCVLIIHGNKGQPGTPVMKSLVNQWLPQFSEVLAYQTAQVKDGGVEAVYVLLKKVSDISVRIPTTDSPKSFLAEETRSMERKRRLAEQQGERKWAPVKAREHSDQEPGPSPEGELQNNILQHPALDNQRFDGVDINLNPEPALNTEARREFDNEQRNQEQEKQLRLGNMPKFSSAPTPRGP